MTRVKIDIPAGTLVEIPAGWWKHGEGNLRLQVQRVLHEISAYYEDEVWIEGTRFDDDGRQMGWWQALVPADALLDAVHDAAGDSGPPRL